jgi:hypothetical protein
MAFKNFAKSTLASGISAGATSVSVATGTGTKFSATAPGNEVVIWDKTAHTDASDDTNAEVVTVSGISGDTLTISATTNSHSAGDGIGAAWTAAAANGISGVTNTKSFTRTTLPQTFDLFSVTLSADGNPAGGRIEIAINGPGDSAAGFYTLIASTIYSVNRYAGTTTITVASLSPTVASGSDDGAINSTWSLTTSVSSNVATVRLQISGGSTLPDSGTINIRVRDFCGHAITFL